MRPMEQLTVNDVTTNMTLAEGALYFGIAAIAVLAYICFDKYINKK